MVSWKGIKRIIRERKDWQEGTYEGHTIEEYDRDCLITRTTLVLAPKFQKNVLECKHRWVGKYHILTYHTQDGREIEMFAYDENNNIIFSRLGEPNDGVWEVTKYDEKGRAILFKTSYGFFESITYEEYEEGEKDD